MKTVDLMINKILKIIFFLHSVIYFSVLHHQAFGQEIILFSFVNVTNFRTARVSETSLSEFIILLKITVREKSARFDRVY